MSDGSVHAKASLFLAAGFSVGALVSQDARLINCVAGALVGVVITPDLDLSNGGMVGGKLIRKRVGWLGERIWKWFWKGYADSFKHGTWASHFPIFSTFVRLAYIYFWSIFVFYFVAQIALKPLGYYFDVGSELLWWTRLFLEPMFFFGLTSSDFIHFALDKLTTKKARKTIRKHLDIINHRLMKKG